MAIITVQYAAAILAILLGLLGIGGTVFALVTVERNLSRLRGGIRDGRQHLLQFADSLEQAGVAAENAAGSIDEAKRSLGIAARMSEDAADTVGKMGDYTDFSVLGVRPLGGVARWLAAEERELGLMSEQLWATAGSLGDDAENMRLLGGDLRQSGKQMETLISQLDGIAGVEGGDLPSKARLGVFAAAGWFLMFSLFLCVLGAALLS